MKATKQNNLLMGINGIAAAVDAALNYVKGQPFNFLGLALLCIVILYFIENE